MNLSEYFIRRPVATFVLSALILLLGGMGIASLPIRQYPELKETVIQVTTTYPGAGADLMQGFITTPIAEALSSAENIDYISSTSSQGSSTVQVHMRLGTDPDAALSEIVAKAQQVRKLLPQDAEEPIVSKGDGRDFALIYFSFNSATRSAAEITEYVKRVIQPRFATLPGAGGVDLFGAKQFAMRIWLDPLRMASRGVTALDVQTAVNKSNYLAAPGRIENQLYALYAETDTTLKTPEDMGALPIRGAGDDIVRLRDVAKVELGVQDYDSRVWFNGKQAIALGVRASPNANPLEVAKAARAEMIKVRSTLPEGMNVDVAFDTTMFIDASISEVYKTLGEAVVIVVLVILLFLGSFRSVLIPVATIPLSLIGVCFILFVMGYSLNLLTLLAMVLAIGLVVDDAIVVVENVHRHIEMGKSPFQAAIDGMKEIFAPVIAMTITLAAVYSPLAFTGGLTGTLFREFAFALAGAVVISGLVAVTLSPMMASRLLQHSHTGDKRTFTDRIDAFFERFSHGYHRVLSQVLDARGVLLGLAVVLLGTGIFLFLNTPGELAPDEDQGALLTILEAPRYASPQYTARYVAEVPNYIGKSKYISSQFTVSGFNGANSGFGFWILTPWAERDKSAKTLSAEMTAKLGGLTGLQGFIISMASLPGAGEGFPVSYVIRGTGSPAEVYEMAEKIRLEAMKSGKFIFIQNGLNYDLPRLRIDVDRDRAAQLGISVSDIGTTLSLLLSNNWISRFDRENRSYDIVPQAADSDRVTPEMLGRYYVRSAGGTMVPLSAVTKVSTYAGPAAITQFNQLNSATLQGMPVPLYTSGQALQELRDIAKRVMPAGFFEDFEGSSRLSQQEGNSTLIAFLLAVIVIYLVLAAQFESLRDPFIIMMAVPLSILGAIIPLNLGASFQITGSSLNIYTQVGMITLIGLITKHGILLVEFANERRNEGMSRREAIEEAARVRLRPILMTTAAMVLAAVPMIIATGAGASARYSMGIVIAFGMSIGTMFTLFVVPTFYTLLSPKNWTARVIGQTIGNEPDALQSPHPAE